jgi:hypothetical protein
MTPQQEQAAVMSRREMFQHAGMGFAGIALASLFGRDAPATAGPARPTAPKPPHFPASAKHVIFMHMVGAPSHLDLFEYKPVLQKFDGELMPEDLWKGLRLAFIRKRPKLMGTPYNFTKHGQCGMEMSELLPHLAEVVDELCMVKSLHTEQFNHAPAQVFLQTGFARFGRPSVGSWVTYGLGSENEDLPAFVVMNTGQIAGAGNSLWGSGFLPTVYQGVEFRSQGDPVLFLSDPDGLDRSCRRRIIDGINGLNKVQLADMGDPEIATRISQYEMAYRMQSAVPELMDTSQEPPEVHALYGTKPGQAGFANNCLLARRLVERGVRFVQLYDQGWDTHSNQAARLPKLCKNVDQPTAALVKDLKQRGLLDETLVVFAAEFGRTPMLQGQSGPGAGRDHHKDAFTIWMAGGGLKSGLVYGATDELGFGITEDPMHVRDFHATVLHLLGLDHEKLTFTFQGRPYRLTDIGGEVAHKLIA